MHISKIHSLSTGGAHSRLLVDIASPTSPPYVIGAGTGPAGPAMAVPFSAEVETKVCVRLLLNYCSKFPAEYVRKCVRIRLTFSMAKLPGLPGECMKAPPDC